MDPRTFRDDVERFVREHELIAPGGDVTVLVSGGLDSTCLWHVVRELGYEVSALHVDHGLRGGESDEDARFCREELGAEVVDGRGGQKEEELREIRYSFATDRLRATGHTLSDQVETVLYRLVSSGAPGWIKARREDRVVRPLLERTREETEAYCRAVGLEYRVDSSNPDTKRGLIRDEILPLLRELHPAADENLLRLAREPSPLQELLAAPVGSARLDLGTGRTLVREYDQVWLEQTPVALDGEVRWGPWCISAEERGLKVRGWRPGDRLAGRSKKIQDVFVDAKIPRSEREAWPLVVRGDEVVAVPGIVDAEGVRAERMLSASSRVAGRATPEGTVQEGTGPQSGVRPATRGGGGAGLRPAGADGGEGGEGVAD
ncbi:MAG TPA: tRNA lysidine(34) synthetase TilS [Gaiellaceae bacterium]|nr:tRNA lysidine(34) synthetase TilS [Gaiellaceae bacterium]